MDGALGPVCTFVLMKFSAKYSQLRDQRSLESIVVSSVYTSMALENQTVPRHYILDALRRNLTQRGS
jgi:hypothetical protein